MSPTRYNNTPDPRVLDWDKPAVFPGEAVEVTDEQAAGLDPNDWPSTPPKNASNQSGGSFDEKPPRDKKDAPKTDAPSENELPAVESPAEQKDVN